jgi:hypothetical protein
MASVYRKAAQKVATDPNPGYRAIDATSEESGKNIVCAYLLGAKGLEVGGCEGG